MQFQYLLFQVFTASVAACPKTGFLTFSLNSCHAENNYAQYCFVALQNTHTVIINVCICWMPVWETDIHAKYIILLNIKKLSLFSDKNETFLSFWD